MLTELYAPVSRDTARRFAPDPVMKALAPILIWKRFWSTRLRPKLFRLPWLAPKIAATTMKIGRRIVAFTVVAEMKSDRTTLIIRKLKKIPAALLPNLSTNQRANLLATRVFTSMLASTNERMFSHITGCPSCANASFCVVTPHMITPRITISEVR